MRCNSDSSDLIAMKPEPSEEQWIVVVHKIKPPRVSRSNRLGRMSRVTQSEECQTVNLEVLGSKPSARDQSTFTRVRVPGVKVVVYLFTKRIRRCISLVLLWLIVLPVSTFPIFLTNFASRRRRSKYRRNQETLRTSVAPSAILCHGHPTALFQQL